MVDFDQSRGLFRGIIIFIIIIIIPIFLILSSAIIFLFSKKRENQSKYQYFSIQIICIIGLTYAILTLFLLHLDLTNTFMVTKLQIDTLYEVFLFGYLIYTIIIIPFAFFFQCRYDENDESFTNIPMDIVEQSTYNDTYESVHLEVDGFKSQSFVSGRFKFQVDYIVYEIGFITCFSWLFFIIVGSYGLSALPLFMITRNPFQWGHGPNRIRKNKLDQIREFLKSKTENLMIHGINIGKKQKDKKPKWYHLVTFQKNVDKIEDQWENSLNRFSGGMSMVGSILSIFIGLVSFVFSFLWLLQILIGTVLKEKLLVYHSFLSLIFNVLDLLTSTFFYFPFVGYFLFILFELYIYLCVLYGSYKILSVIDGKWIFPRLKKLKKRQTPLMHLLIYLFITFFSTFAIMELSYNSFQGYANNTSLGVLYRNVLHYVYVFDIYFGFIPILFVTASFIFLVINIITVLFFSKRFDQKKEFLEFVKEYESMNKKNE